MDQDLSLKKRVDEFLNPIPHDDALYGHGTRAAVASMFLTGLDLTTYPTFRATPFEKIERVLGWPRTPADALSGALHAHHLSFASPDPSAVRVE